MKLCRLRASSRKKARSSSLRAGIRLTSKIRLLCSGAGLIGAIALQAPFAFGKIAVGVDLGYRALSLRSDLDSQAFLQVDIGSTWYSDGVSLGADYCKIYPRKKSSAVDPEVFYGVGAEIGAWGHYSSAVAVRLPFGVSWDIKDTPLQIGAAAVPVLAFASGFSAFGIELSIPFRWRLD